MMRRYYSMNLNEQILSVTLFVSLICLGRRELEKTLSFQDQRVGEVLVHCQWVQQVLFHPHLGFHSFQECDRNVPNKQIDCSYNY